MSFIAYLVFRFFLFPLQFFPYFLLHRMGLLLGFLVFHFYPKYRKRALSNLALATDLDLNPKQIVSLAKKSIQNMSITVLEYPRLRREKSIDKIATCENPEEVYSLMQSGQTVIFFAGHQANWEIGFLEATQRMPGMAIGKPIKNRFLYQWIVSIRKKYGALIISPKGAYKQALQCLKEGRFVGIVGDQGMPDSRFSSSFLGREAWTSPLPALLSKKSGAPVIVATTKREQGKYIITYSRPVWPRDTIKSQMEEILRLFEASIKNRPHEWLWTHNRWKQQLPGYLKKEFRHDSIAFIFPKNQEMIDCFPKIREFYPREHITVFIPFFFEPPLNAEVRYYHQIEEVLILDYRFKLVVDFTHNQKIQNHFSCLSALHVKAFDHPRDFFFACQ